MRWGGGDMATIEYLNSHRVRCLPVERVAELFPPPENGEAAP